MQKNDLILYNNAIHRVLDIQNNNLLLINCCRQTMPRWYKDIDYTPVSEDDLYITSGIRPIPIEELDNKSRGYAYKRYNMIAGIIPFVGDSQMRCQMIDNLSKTLQVSKQTLRHTLCTYLVYQNISIFAPKKQTYKRPLTDDEKNIRWALNKYFYTQNKYSLQSAYLLMLKEKYCDKDGQLLPNHPTINQFRYFYRKTKKFQTFYIARNGLKDYQKNYRPLIGNGVQSFAPTVGTAMLDSTICDIYLINDAGELIGRPILTACIDAYSSFCYGYYLSWEGGVYSLKGLLSNVITDKVELCNNFGILIKSDIWNCVNMLPAILVTDKGKEYQSFNFEQITELGVTIINLPAFRPELKGVVEKFFDLIQNLYKPYLKGKGVIEPDFQQRGKHDYRKDACLTLRDFETIILRCIIYYNSQRVLEAFPYTETMLVKKIKPYACDIWNWGRQQEGVTLIPINHTQLMLTLLPRTKGIFSRKGLTVNNLHYHCEGFTEKYLQGGVAICAYNPDNVSYVWVVENGNYTKFNLIEVRFKDESLADVKQVQQDFRTVVKNLSNDNNQSKIKLIKHIEVIAKNPSTPNNVEIRNTRSTRQKQVISRHIDYMKGEE